MRPVKSDDVSVLEHYRDLRAHVVLTRPDDADVGKKLQAVERKLAAARLARDRAIAADRGARIADAEAARRGWCRSCRRAAVLAA